jgi:NADPH:quinone reductase-like Zn-dependent oxidoreductase
MRASMRVIEIEKPGGPDVLRPAQRPRPVPKSQEILVKVAAAGVNRPDVLQRHGHNPLRRTRRPS